MTRPDQHERILGMISPYLDGELTQADGQRVRLYLEENEEARQAFREMQELQQLTSTMKFRDPSEEVMEALETRLSVQAPRRFGWGLVIIGLVAWTIYAAVLFIRNPRMPTLPELFGGAVITGLVMLFVSVLRQRVLERPHDRYRKVRK